MAVIREMLSRMETEHKTKLEQLHLMQEQQRCVCVYSFISLHTLIYTLILLTCFNNQTVINIHGKLSEKFA